ncbi:MAG TPA: Gfo/Idh/MocA family oxidoreductase [Capsulimonadaceae bacterium]
MSDHKFRWGILGPGNIAHKFATGLSVLPDHQLVAVGSRSTDKADAFAKEYGGSAKVYGSYEALVADPDIDAIYVATPHTFHREHSLLCINAGKPVLSEKPFAVNEKQAAEVVAASRAKGVFAMEAMWSRFFPLITELKKVIADGTIGEVRMVQADFGFRAGVNPEGRLFSPALAGGGLLDVGVYTVSFSSLILGEPNQVTGIATIGETGVDEQNGLVLGHASGAISLLSSAVRTNSLHEATITGTDGRIRLSAPFWIPKVMTITAGGKDEVREVPYEGNGYNYQAVEVAKQVKAGKIESDIMPLDETLAILRTMDKARAQWGLKYPCE